MAYGGYGGGNYGHNPNPYTTNYGAQGGADGGGFMGGSQGGSQPTGKGTYGKETLRPLTIFQILEAEQPHPDADFKVDDVEISQISLVGQIRNISKQTTNLTYRLEDGTGTVEVKVWIDTDAPTHDEQGQPLPQAREPLQQDDWVKVWGKLKSFNNRRHVGAFSMKRITDKNEINYHLLEATYVHLYFTKGALDQANGHSNGASAGAGGDTAMQDAGDTGGYNRALPRLGAHAQKVYNALLNTPQGHEGLHVQQIAGAAGLSVPDVLKGGDELMGHALIFTTLDDNTWALMND